MRRVALSALLMLIGCGQDIAITQSAICDGLLQKGEATVDDGFDADSDGYFDARNPGCQATYPADQLDCDDGDPAVNPGADELCDGLDNDCDGLLDDSDPDLSDGSTYYQDGDGDGFGDAESPVTACGPGPELSSNDSDCEDAEPSVNPEAPELCDGLDNDCDGETDEDDAIDMPEWYADVDGDSFGDPTSSLASCAQPEGFVAGDEDCDDTLAAVNPLADELCDGLDNNCDGRSDEASALDALRWYPDNDGDGYGEPGQPQHACEAPNGYVSLDTDCDDLEPSVYPGAAEVCVDGLVNDCELSRLQAEQLCGPHGTFSLSVAEAVLVGEGISDEAGQALTGLGDVNNDGYDDLLIGAAYDDDGGVDAGAGYLLLGPITGTVDLSNADAKLSGEQAGDLAGTSVAAAGDVNNDGYQDLLIGAYLSDRTFAAAGTSYLVLGPVTADMSLSAADAMLVGASSYDYAGQAVAGAGDVNNDGYDDLLVGAPFADDSAINSGTSYLVLGPITGQHPLDTADARLIGEVAYDRSGWPVAGVGDMNGDGNHDILVGAYREDSGGNDAGASYLLYGPVTGDVSLADANAKMVGENTQDYAGRAVASAGDVNADGYGDLLIGAYLEDSSGNNAGTAYLFLGPVSGSFDMSLADARLLGESASDSAGWSVDGAGDVDADGYSDILVGAYGDNSGGSSAGAAYLWMGPVTGSQNLSGAEAKMRGQAATDKAGWAVSGAGDTTGNGHDDVLVGAPFNNAGGSDAGAAYLVLGAGI